MLLNPRLMSLTKGFRARVALCVGLGLSVAAASVVQGFLMADVIAHVVEGGAFAGIWLPLFLILGLVILRMTVVWGKRLAEMLVAAGVRQKLRARLYRHLLKLGPGYLNKARTGKVQSTMVDGVEALEGYFGSYVPQVFITLAIPLCILAYLFTVDVLVAALILGAMVATLLAPKLWERLLGNYGESHWSAYANLNAQFVDNMQGMTTLKAFNAAERRGAELRRESHHLYKRTMMQLGVSMLSTGVVGLTMRAGSALAVAAGALRLSQGQITVEELLLILFLTGECIRPLADLDAAWHQGYMGLSAATGIFALLDQQPGIEEPARSVHPPGHAALPSLSFEAVSFAYEPERKALDQLSLGINPGETVALVGPSGAGKTTVVSLLLRFFDPDSGTIAIDGEDIRNIPLERLRAMTAVVSQDTYLFHGTVADNLRLGNPDATQEELEAGAKAAQAHDFIARLPKGYETLVGERGLNLSGGERQRIAIARALIKDAPLLVLDEATASVDAANEESIRRALANLTRHRTTLVIAHRLSTVIDADRIFVLEKGRLAETGKHDELLRDKGIYARLTEAQEAMV